LIWSGHYVFEGPVYRCYAGRDEHLC
jgi:Arm DNA-binding domain